MLILLLLAILQKTVLIHVITVEVVEFIDAEELSTVSVLRLVPLCVG